MFTRCALSASTSFSSSAHIVPSIIGNYVITHIIRKAKPKSHQFITKISFHISQNKKQKRGRRKRLIKKIYLKCTEGRL